MAHYTAWPQPQWTGDVPSMKTCRQHRRQDNVGLKIIDHTEPLSIWIKKTLVLFRHVISVWWLLFFTQKVYSQEVVVLFRTFNWTIVPMFHFEAVIGDVSVIIPPFWHVNRSHWWVTIGLLNSLFLFSEVFSISPSQYLWEWRMIEIYKFYFYKNVKIPLKLSQCGIVAILILKK